MPCGPFDVRVSKNGRQPCWSGDSMVNCILGSKEFRWVRNCCECSACEWQVSSTKLSNILCGLGNELRTLVSKSSIKRLAMIGLGGIPLQHPLSVQNSYLEK